jgi:hypothetical protein
MATTTETANRTEAQDDGRQAGRAADAYQAARERTSSAYRSTRETVSSAGRRTGEQISANPVGAVIGGFALGAIVAAVLPRTERETQALGTVGHKLTDAARSAVQSATQAGKEQIEQIRETAVTQVGHAVVDAVTGSNQ